MLAPPTLAGRSKDFGHAALQIFLVWHSCRATPMSVPITKFDSKRIRFAHSDTANIVRASWLTSIIESSESRARTSASITILTLRSAYIAISARASNPKAIRDLARSHASCLRITAPMLTLPNADCRQSAQFQTQKRPQGSLPAAFFVLGMRSPLARGLTLSSRRS